MWGETCLLQPNSHFAFADDWRTRRMDWPWIAIDNGATGLRITWSITIPLLRPALAFVEGVRLGAVK